MNESNSKAAYRFFSNENVELSDIMQPHLESNDKRIIDHEYVLNIQDTSCLNYYYHDSKRDKGHIGTSAQKVDSLGYWLHVGMLCSTDGIPLGLSYQEIWAREAIKNEDKDKKKSRLRLEPIENKESVRWLDGTDACARYAAKGKKVVQVCDWEADIFEFMKNCKDKNNSFIVRARSNRSIQIGEKVNQLFSCTKSTPVIGSYKISIEGNSERLPKTVQVNVKYKSIEILPPKTNRPAETYKKFKPIKASFIEVYSRCKVNGQKLHWRLLTNLDVKEIPVEEIIKWYVQRWRIEIFFKSLKSGTKIEICRLTNIESLSKFILMQSIIAFRVLELLYIGRMTKNRSIKTVISESEWLVYKRILFPKHRRPPEKVSIWIEKIAQFGGFIKGKNRKPGILTLWDGWSKLNTMLKGIYAAGFAG